MLLLFASVALSFDAAAFFVDAASLDRELAALEAVPAEPSAPDPVADSSPMPWLLALRARGRAQGPVRIDRHFDDGSGSTRLEQWSLHYESGQLRRAWGRIRGGMESAHNRQLVELEWEGDRLRGVVVHELHFEHNTCDGYCPSTYGSSSRWEVGGKPSSHQGQPAVDPLDQKWRAEEEPFDAVLFFAGWDGLREESAPLRVGMETLVLGTAPPPLRSLDEPFLARVLPLRLATWEEVERPQRAPGRHMANSRSSFRGPAHPALVNLHTPEEEQRSTTLRYRSGRLVEVVEAATEGSTDMMRRAELIWHGERLVRVVLQEVSLGGKPGTDRTRQVRFTPPPGP